MPPAAINKLLSATEAPNLGVAMTRLGQYIALRLWVVLMGCFPIHLNLITARMMGKFWWFIKKQHRERAMANLRPALGDTYTDRQLRIIARRSFEHFTQLYLVELVMTPRLVNPWSWARYVEFDNLGPALRELLTQRGAILLTGHFGNYELLGATICRLGIPLTAIMRPIDNPLINRYLVRSRKASGLDLLYKKGVTAAATDVIDRGGALCFIGDQDAGRKGLFVNFFNRPASTYKSIGLLAMRKRVPIIVGSAARLRRGTFRYRISVHRIIHPAEWDPQDDPLRWITQTFSNALEHAIRLHPEQYLWVHRRWKHRPRNEKAMPAPTTAQKTGR